MIIQRALKRHPPSYLVKGSFKRAFGILTGPLRSLPDFLIIGAQRCGTTSLFNYLSQHPAILPSFPKEVHFFSNHYDKGLTWYRSHFPLEIQRRRSGMQNGKQRCMAVEGTPYYFSHPLAPRRIFEAVPEARLLLLLRNPGDRAYSHYQYEVKLGFESLSFEEAIEAEAERLASEKEKILQDQNYHSFAHQHYSYLSRGKYIDFLGEWESFLNRGKILVLKSEDFYVHPEKTITQVLEFLGLPDWKVSKFKKYNFTTYAPMQPKTRQHLNAVFEADNARLSDALGANFDWGSD